MRRGYDDYDGDHRVRDLVDDFAEVLLGDVDVDVEIDFVPMVVSHTYPLRRSEMLWSFLTSASMLSAISFAV